MALVLLAEGNLLGPLVTNTFLCVGVRAAVVVLAVRDNDLRGTLNVDSDSVLQLWMSNSSDASLQVGVEGDFDQNSIFLLGHGLMHSDIGVLEPLDEGDLGAVADRDVERVFGHLDVGLRVEDNALLDLVNDVLIELAVHEGVLARVLDVE